MAPMRDTLLIQDPAQADVLLRPGRAELLQRLAEPRSCPALGRDLGQAPQQVYYHVKALERAGLVDRVGDERVRGFTGGLYQAAARSYWLSPKLVSRLGGPRRTRDQMSLSFILDLAEEMHDEVGQLAQSSGETPSAGLSATIALRDPTRRAAFLQDVREATEAIARKYGGPATSPDATYKLVIACYPHQGEDTS